jgi:hypothetical protein
VSRHSFSHPFGQSVLPIKIQFLFLQLLAAALRHGEGTEFFTKEANVHFDLFENEVGRPDRED